MTSKEALEDIVIDFDNMGMICSNLCYEEFYCKDLHFKEIFKTEYESILRDLDRLEKLEKENKNSKEELGMYIDTYYKFYEENKKLKKVIEILKTKKVNIFHLYVFDTYEQYKEHYPFAEYNNKKDMLNKKEYKILKEYL